MQTVCSPCSIFAKFVLRSEPSSVSRTNSIRRTLMPKPRHGRSTLNSGLESAETASDCSGMMRGSGRSEQSRNPLTKRRVQLAFAFNGRSWTFSSLERTGRMSFPKNMFMVCRSLEEGDHGGRRQCLKNLILQARTRCNRSQSTDKFIIFAPGRQAPRASDVDGSDCSMIIVRTTVSGRLTHA